MRQRRIKVNHQRAVYHCITRVVGGAFLLESDEAKEVLRKQIHKVARFCGVEILTYCIMSNHFHVMVRVPGPEDFDEISDAELLKRCLELYGNDEISMLQWENRLGTANEEARAENRRRLLARMGDVSAFMKELKQRFSIWYNRTHNRFGTLWAERFKSVLVENKLSALMMVAAYIDLNPVRAGIVEDPKDYRYCGYSEMLAKVGMVSSGLGGYFLRSGYSKERALGEYRKLLFGVGYKIKYSGGPVIDQDEVREVMQADGKLSQSELIRHRVRYFTDGAVLGSRTFVKQAFHDGMIPTSTRQTDRFSLLPFKGNEELAVFRNLRKDVIG